MDRRLGSKTRRDRIEDGTDIPGPVVPSRAASNVVVPLRLSSCVRGVA